MLPPETKSILPWLQSASTPDLVASLPSMIRVAILDLPSTEDFLTALFARIGRSPELGPSVAAALVPFLALPPPPDESTAHGMIISSMPPSDAKEAEHQITDRSGVLHLSLRAHIHPHTVQARDAYTHTHAHTHTERERERERESALRLRTCVYRAFVFICARQTHVLAGLCLNRT
jgi:hypothetical protein